MFKEFMFNFMLGVMLPIIFHIIFVLCRDSDEKVTCLCSYNYCFIVNKCCLYFTLKLNSRINQIHFSKCQVQCNKYTIIVSLIIICRDKVCQSLILCYLQSHIPGSTYIYTASSSGLQIWTYKDCSSAL